jgi:magnesium chelatase family protein
MLCKTYCATCIGITAVTVTVEVDLSNGIGIHLVGLPDNAVKESLLRVTTALSTYGYRIPGRKLVFNLAPADIRKEGSSYDLAIAIGLLAVSEQVYLPGSSQYIMLGELSLDGRIRNVTGALPIAEHAKEMGFKGCIFPKESALEAADVEEIDIYGVSTLNEVLDILREDNCSHLLVVRDPQKSYRPHYSEDFKHVKGQRLAKRGLEIAAAGGHNLLLVGTPGSGKTFMASCLPSILPQMSRDESIETSKIYSITGNRTGKRGLMLERPFRNPHHSASLVSLIGGGQNASPGEVSLAHNGILYLDEMAQFSKTILDALRQPLEDGKVTISRARYKVEYPASFMLIASTNPCPCGYYGDDSHKCTCTQSAVMRYMSRISGPMLDRLDMHIFVKAVSGDDLIAEGEEEPSEAIAKRVMAARQIQYERFKNEGIFTNSQMNVQQLNTYCKVSKEQKRFLRDVIHRLNLSARSYSRILKLSRTIADIDGDNFISLQHISEAIQFRNLDRGNFYD